MLIRRGTDAFKTQEFPFPTPDKAGIQYFLVNEGEFESGINSLARSVLAPGFCAPYHMHDACEEIFTVVSGNVVYTDAEKNQHTVHAGDVMVCNRGEGHALANPFPEPAIVIELNLPVAPK